MADFLAVYGSLRRGMQAASKMERMEFVGRGAINASLYALGWYPGVELDNKGNRTIVDVFKLPEAERLREAILYDLDGYEGYNERNSHGSLFVRKVVRVESLDSGFWMPDQDPIAAYVYEYAYPVNRAPLVENGDWCEYNQIRNATA